MLLLGLDLAWGERNPDGLCLVRATRGRAEILASERTQGDEALLAWVRRALGPPSARRQAFAAVDAPLVCPNLTGARPVDRLTHRLFARFHAGCYPANLGKCPRPARIRARLATELGFNVGWGLPPAVPRAAAEVYPHPALVRMLGLPRIIKYKKGPVPARREEWQRLQRLLGAWLRREHPEWVRNAALRDLLAGALAKDREDRLDAFVCALIAHWHWKHGGERSEVIGDDQTGFILLPAAPSPMAIT